MQRDTGARASLSVEITLSRVSLAASQNGGKGRRSVANAKRVYYACHADNGRYFMFMFMKIYVGGTSQFFCYLGEWNFFGGGLNGE